MVGLYIWLHGHVVIYFSTEAQWVLCKISCVDFESRQFVRESLFEIKDYLKSSYKVQLAFVIAYGNPKLEDVYKWQNESLKYNDLIITGKILRIICSVNL